MLAALVLFTSLGIRPAQLLGLRRRAGALAALVVGPFVLLAPLAWLSACCSRAPSAMACSR